MKEFQKGRVPISEAAKILKKDAAWVRAGIIEGWLPIGMATKDGKRVTDISEIDGRKGRISYYISPKLLYEFTGYLYGGNDGTRKL